MLLRTHSESHNLRAGENIPAFRRRNTGGCIAARRIMLYAYGRLYTGLTTGCLRFSGEANWRLFADRQLCRCPSLRPLEVFYGQNNEIVIVIVIFHSCNQKRRRAGSRYRYRKHKSELNRPLVWIRPAKPSSRISSERCTRTIRRRTTRDHFLPLRDGRRRSVCKHGCTTANPTRMMDFAIRKVAPTFLGLLSYPVRSAHV